MFQHRCRRASCPTRTRAISSPSSWRRTRRASTSCPAITERAQKIASADPAVQDVASVAGYSLLDGQLQNNAGIIFASLKPFEERTDASMLSFAALKRLNAQFAEHPGRRSPSRSTRRRYPGMGTTGGFEFYLQNRGSGDPRATGAAVTAFLDKARAAARAAGRVDDLPRGDASSCSSTSTATRPKCSASGRRRVPDDAGVLRLADRRPVLAVQPRLVGDPAGGRRATA